MHPPRQTRRSAIWNRGWPEITASALAFAGLVTAVFIGFDPHGRQNAGSDFKTLYASAWCYSHHLDAYQFPNLAAVFHANHVVEPLSWYGHAPVYPPFSLALLGPLTRLPMVPALCLWIVLSGILMALATASLARSAGRVFGVPILLRLLIVGVVACSPLVSLGLELGNVSVAVVALCILAVTSKPERSAWPAAIGLSAALILKPHIAFWAVLSLLFARTSADRKLLKQTAAITAAALSLIVLGMLYDGTLGSQIASYRAIVLSELSNGSMSPGNRDLMEIEVQITSFAHLLGYLLKPGLLPRAINAIVLAGTGIAVAWSALRFSRTATEPRYVIAPAMFAFGLLATYHRQADSMLLLALLPYLLSRLHRNWKDLWAWAASALLVAGSFGPSLTTMRWLAAEPGVYSGLLFVALRQAAIVNLCLELLLIGALAFDAEKWDARTGQRHHSA
jgi:hypothetical protein